jgi:PAS domain S-box-containing protein
MTDNNSSTDYKNKFNECDERFQKTFSLTSAASKIINSDLKILKVNKAMTELLGYSAEEIEGTQILDYACKEYKHYWHELQEAMWKHGKPSFKLDACIVRKDGQIAWVHVTTVLFQENGVDYGFTVLDDFSYRKQFEETQKRLNMALDYSGMAVWELNTADGSIVHSDTFDKIFGYDQPLNNWNKDVLLNQFLDEDKTRLNDVLSSFQTNPEISFQGRIKKSDGVLKWVYLQGKAQTIGENEPQKILGTIYDITREKLADRHKDDFITIASHELKTPITVLKASLQLMKQVKIAANERLGELIEQANKSMGKVSFLVEDLLNASKMNEGQLHLKKTKFNLNSAIAECCNQITAAGHFSIETTGDAEIEMTADVERVQRVLINFVSNAMKYAPHSKIITIHQEKMDNHVKVSVTDRGPGVQPEKIPHLFDRYFRVDNEGSQYSGLGLGLYISAEIIKKHGGEVGVESEVGKGSTFWFTIPIS